MVKNTKKDGVALTPSQARAKISEIIKDPKCIITYPTDNWNNLLGFVNTILQADGGLTFLINQNELTRTRCYNMMYDEDVPETQKYYQLITIAKCDMIVQAILFCVGNQKIKELSGWKPTFEMDWQLKAKAIIESRSVGWDTHPHWRDTYHQVVKPYQKMGTVVTKEGKVELPIRVDSIADVKLDIQEEGLGINIHDLTHFFDWHSLPAFWDNRSKKRNVNAELLFDLIKDIDDCLKKDGLRNQTFCTDGRKANKQISALSRVLDNVILIQNDRGSKATERWFRLDEKHSEPRYYPKFRHNSEKLNVVNRIADKVRNKSPQEIADVIENGMDYHSPRKTKLSIDYEYEDFGIYEEEPKVPVTDVDEAYNGDPENEYD